MWAGSFVISGGSTKFLLLHSPPPELRMSYVSCYNAEHRWAERGTQGGTKQTSITVLRGENLLKLYCSIQIYLYNCILVAAFFSLYYCTGDAAANDKLTKRRRRSLCCFLDDSVIYFFPSLPFFLSIIYHIFFL